MISNMDRRISLKNARQISGLTQRQVSQALGYSLQSIIKWEHNPDSLTLGRAKNFAELYGFKLEEISFYTK